MSTQTDRAAVLGYLYDYRDNRVLREEALALECSLCEFIAAAWHVLKPHEPFKRNWHIDAICYHLEAVTAGEIRRLQIWVPPGSMKSGAVSVFWPAWEWTTRPWLRYWTASYDLRLSGRLSSMSRDLLVSEWYWRRWGHRFRMTKEGEHYFANDQGGTRLATAPGSTGIGEHGHRILIDDAINAKDANATSKAILMQTNDWFDATVPGRQADPTTTAIVNIQQRLHEADLAGHLLEIEPWVVLCLPERFERNHQFVWRGQNVHPAVKELARGTPLENGDPRHEEGELLWPTHRDEAASDAFARTLRPHRAAGQLQQRPASREGEIIQRSWWRFYDQTIREKEEWGRLPKKISRVVVSVDTPLKDKQSSDNCAIQVWGVAGADRFLLDLELGKMNYNKAKRRLKEMALWARRRWPNCPHHILIENAGYGVELIVDLKPEIPGILKLSPGQEGDKEVRADAAADSLESGNVYLPGVGPPAHSEFNERATSDDVVKFIDNCATFPFAANDDDVDAWSLAMNWLRGKQTAKTRIHSAAGLIRAGR